MKAFRIGRKPTGPWNNMTPPIRAASSEATSTTSTPYTDAAPVLAEKQPLLDQGLAADNGSTGVESGPRDGSNSGKSAAAVAGDRGSLQTGCQLKPNSCSRRPSPSGFASMPLPPAEVIDEKALEAANGLPRGRKQMSPDKYTEWAMQQEKEFDMGEYPSLDHEVQLAITAKYMKLNDEVEARGYYKCNYLEYGKEMVRYTILFGLSMLALHKAWYLTSALFLGLFWVST